MYFNKIAIYYDGTDIPKSDIKIDGFTTNPSILKKSGITDSYKKCAVSFLKKTNNLPVSFEVLSDETHKMIEEAKEISSWGDNIYVKIPIINTKGVFNTEVISELNRLNIKQNITALFTQKQVDHCFNIIKNSNTENILSIFSGRIADTGIDPKILCKYTTKLLKNTPHIKSLWASSREVFNVFEAIESGCDIITLNQSIFKKLKLVDKDLDKFSEETVQMFVNDGKNSGLSF